MMTQTKSSDWCWSCCWKTDACVGVFLLPVVFVAVCANSFSLVFSSIFCSGIEQECSPETFIKFCPCSDLNGIEFMSAGDITVLCPSVCECLDSPQITSSANQKF